ncbi:hypothetical protein SOVF_201370 [Spinacia oleracea]|nr:hypothetical protein SOVF_201370 [Spinacia oleracea]
MAAQTLCLPPSNLVVMPCPRHRKKCGKSHISPLHSSSVVF